MAPIGALLSKVPYRSGESTYVAAPMFHGLGFTQMVLSVTLGCTTIVQRRFGAERVLEAVAVHRPTALVVVPGLWGAASASVIEMSLIPGLNLLCTTRGGSVSISFCNSAVEVRGLVASAARRIPSPSKSRGSRRRYASAYRRPTSVP